jgi:hypothetical protein
MKGLKYIKPIKDIVIYNLKIVFANKFIYFLIAAIAFFLMVISIMLFSDANPDRESIYDTLLLPGFLIIFYPIIFNIQNDKDSRILEIIFAVPNYRYKVYLIRFIISYLVLILLLFFMAWFSYFSVVKIHILEMVYQLMFPMLFIGGLSFLMSSLIKNGRGASVVMIIIGLFFFIFGEELEYSKWYIFLNPFNIPSEMSHEIWISIIFQNRLILVIGSAVSILWGLINLQNRERFI